MLSILNKYSWVFVLHSSFSSVQYAYIHDMNVCHVWMYVLHVVATYNICHMSMYMYVCHVCTYIHEFTYNIPGTYIHIILYSWTAESVLFAEPRLWQAFPKKLKYLHMSRFHGSFSLDEISLKPGPPRHLILGSKVNF